jgi:hypothetical protein
VSARESIRCGSVVCGAGGSALSNVMALGFDPYAQATHALFTALRRLTSEMDPRFVPTLTPHQQTQLTEGLGAPPDVNDNDGIVPVLSQVWGELLHVARADHFDVIGHFRTTRTDRVHYDWLASACHFDHDEFEATWSKVARFLCR